MWKILFLRQATEAVAIETLMVNGQSGVDFCFSRTRENGKPPNKAKKPTKKSLLEEIQNHSLGKIHARKKLPSEFCARARLRVFCPLIYLFTQSGAQWAPEEIKDYS